MADSKSISQLPIAEDTTASDLIETSIYSNLTGGQVSRKNTIGEVGNFIVNEQLYQNELQTTAKTIIGAINEAAQSSGGEGIKPQVKAYEGVKTQIVSEGSCSLIKIIFDDFTLVQIDGWFKANGKIDTAAEQTPLFVFDEGVIDSSLGGKAGLMYAFSGGTGYWTRFNLQNATNSFNCFYGTGFDGWYSFSQTFIIVNQEA